MSKRNSILITALVVTAALSAAVMVFALKFYTPKAPVYVDAGAQTGGVAPEFASVVKASGDLAYPLLPTDFDGIFYVADPSGKAAFYQYAGGKLSPYAGETDTVKVTVTCSYEDITADVSYVSVGGKMCGYGLYTAANSPKPAKNYDYMFFKLTELPDGYGSGDAMLLCDRDSTDFCLPDKLWEEAFTLELPSGETSRIASNIGRSYDESGAMRSDWAMLTDSFLRRTDSDQLFLTGRDRNIADKGRLTDIIETDRSIYTRDRRVLTGLVGTWFAEDAEGWHFLRENAVGDGFTAVVYKDGEETAVKELAGSYYDDYIKSGNFVLNKKTLVLTCLTTGKDEILTKNHPAREPAYFTVSPDGKTVVLAYSGVIPADNPSAPPTQALEIYSISGKTFESFKEPGLFFENYPNFTWTSSGALVFMRPSGDGLAWAVMTF